VVAIAVAVVAIAAEWNPALCATYKPCNDANVLTSEYPARFRLDAVTG
jgi:hypothetical protein